MAMDFTALETMFMAMLAARKVRAVSIEFNEHRGSGVKPSEYAIAGEMKWRDESARETADAEDRMCVLILYHEDGTVETLADCGLAGVMQQSAAILYGG